MGRAKEIIVKVIPSNIAIPFVKANHYSGKVKQVHCILVVFWIINCTGL